MIDLHCHSTFSDGSSTPEELIALAEQGGLTALALTDHDTTSGLDRFFSAASNSAVKAVAGIELSAEFGAVALHILGYFFDPENQTLQESLAWVQSGRAERNEQMLKKLNALGYGLSMEAVQAHAGEDVIGRPHFADALIETGQFKHPKKIYQQLLGKGKVAYVERRRLSPEKCVELICKAGGVPVIAHPGQMKLTSNKLRRLARQLKPYGLGGLEVLHPSHHPHQVLALERICADLDLAPTGGTDFHGRITPDLKLGIGFGELVIPDELLEGIRRRLPSL
ncbi:MAG: PHP domain-containing protein [Kiritimatiellaceae bacterium]|nr:PHP domain-containing protein [Kiritimatiellaceae bacterium]